MDTQEDTLILNMKKDFRTFISGTARPTMDSSKRQAGFNISEVQDSMEASKTQHGRGLQSSKLSSSLSMKSLMEKSQEVKRNEADLIQARTDITSLKAKCQSLETSRKRARIDYDTSLESIKQEQKRDQDKVSELRQQLHQLTKREEEVHIKLGDCQKQLTSSKNLYESKLTAVQKEKLKLKSRLEELEESSRNEIFQLNKEKMRQDMEMKICQSELEETKQQMAAAQRRCVEARKQLQDLEEDRLKAMNAEMHIKDLQTTISRMEEDAVVTKAMRSQLSKIPELERENRRLLEENNYCKNTQENVLLLREELEGCKQKLHREKARASLASELEIRCKDLEKKLQAWESCDITNAKSPQSPALLKRHMSDLQRNNLLIMEKQGKLQAGAHMAEEALQIKQTELSTLQEQLSVHKQRCLQQADFIKRLQRKLLLVSKERDVYKDMIDSETSPSMKPGPASNADHVKQLEDVLERYLSHQEQLESKLDEVTSQLSESNTRCSLLEARIKNRGQELPPVTSDVDQKIIAELRTQVAGLEKDLECVTEERSILEARIEQRHLQGDYDPTKTKVLHMPLNPASVALKQRAVELARLREENAELSERVKFLEENGGATEDLTFKVQQKLEQPGNSKEIEEMRAQVVTAELKNKRLMEAFKKKSQEFREVCFQLLGYRIDIPTDNQYRLMSIYAESPEEFLLFQQNSSGVVEMLSSEYAATLEDKIDAYLQQSNSIPAFLSSITMMLFSRQTMYQSTMTLT